MACDTAALTAAGLTFCYVGCIQNPDGACTDGRMSMFGPWTIGRQSKSEIAGDLVFKTEQMMR